MNVHEQLPILYRRSARLLITQFQAPKSMQKELLQRRKVLNNQIRMAELIAQHSPVKIAAN